jgi:hypothetical protein
MKRLPSEKSIDESAAPDAPATRPALRSVRRTPVVLPVSRARVSAANSLLASPGVKVAWIRNKRGGWSELATADLGVIAWQGICMVWIGEVAQKALFVGRGDVRSSIASLRQGGELKRFRKLGKMYVTWAMLPAAQQAGVEQFLVKTLNPVIRRPLCAAQPIVVNFPWAG